MSEPAMRPPLDPRYASPGDADAAPALDWDADGLRRALDPWLPGIAVDVAASLPSTNTALLERARGPGGDAVRGDVRVRRSVESAAFGQRRALDRAPRLLVAERQTAGRGRQGRRWQSAPGASLTFSLAAPLDAHNWSGLSLAVGVALAEALAPAGGERPRPMLKWPNDLWLVDGTASGRKLGGILIETVAAGAERLAVIGVGLNVACFDAEDVSTGFATLQELDPSLTAPRALHRVAPALARALRQFECEGYAAFASRFERLDLLRDRAVGTTLAAAPDGIARGVSAGGALLLDTPAGRIELTSGEVSVRPLAADRAATLSSPVDRAPAAPAADPSDPESSRC